MTKLNAPKAVLDQLKHKKNLTEYFRVERHVIDRVKMLADKFGCKRSDIYRAAIDLLLGKYDK